ncbi:MAG: MaoC family dehydratase [Thermoplasmata archaeon]
MTELKIGDSITGGKITVTESHVVGFAGLTGDFNPLHTDEEYARTTSFGGRIAHGLLSLSLALGLVSQHIHGYFLYGFDRIRFIKPVKLGESVFSTLTVKGSSERERYVLFDCTLSLKKSDGSEVLNAAILLGKMKGE